MQLPLLNVVAVHLSAVKYILFVQVVYSSKDPVWEEGFTFFVHDVKTQQLNVQVCSLILYVQIVKCHNTFVTEEWLRQPVVKTNLKKGLVIQYVMLI